MEESQPDPQEERDDLSVVSLPRLSAAIYCVRCGSNESVNYGARMACRNCGATWQSS